MGGVSSTPMVQAWPATPGCLMAERYLAYLVPCSVPVGVKHEQDPSAAGLVACIIGKHLLHQLRCCTQLLPRPLNSEL